MVSSLSALLQFPRDSTSRLLLPTCYAVAVERSKVCSWVVQRFPTRVCETNITQSFTNFSHNVYVSMYYNFIRIIIWRERKLNHWYWIGVFTVTTNICMFLEFVIFCLNLLLDIIMIFILYRYVSDASTGIFICTFLFAFPSSFPCLKSHSTGYKLGPPILDWKTVQAKLPWGVIILLGGGFALADMCKVSL